MDLNAATTRTATQAKRVLGCIHYVYHKGGAGGGADDFDWGSQFFWKGTRRDVKIFHNRKGGGASFFL